MKKILFILLLITSFANAQSSFKDAEHEFTPACNNGKSIVMARFWFHINATDTVWKVYYFDSTGKNYTPTGSVTLGFCFKADTGALSMFQKMIDSLSSINNKMAINNLQNDTIINRLDSLNAKTYFDSSWYKHLRAIEINLRDSLRTFNYKYDSMNIVRNDTIISKLNGLMDTTMKNVSTYFQVKDCAGANVGAPEKVVKGIIMNKILTNICNASDLKDTSINPIIRLLQKNIADSLRTFQYSYLDTTNARLLELTNKTYFDSSWYSVLRALQINVKDSLRTYNYKYDSINIVRNDSILAQLKANKDSVLNLVHSKYQVADCNGNNIGTPQDVLKTIILNNVTTRICNTEDFKSDTSINSVLRAMQKNLADSLRIFRFQYSYFDSLQATADALLAKTTFDSSWYSVLRDIRTNIKDSLRIFKYSYLDTTNARLAQLLLKQFADTSINPTLRQLQKNVADSLRTFNYSYLDTTNFYLKQLANKSTDSTLIKASATFQVKDCDGNNVGTPENVLKTTVLNKITASICNLSDIKGDTSANAILRAIKTNLADSLRTFKYSYLDTVNAKLSSLLTKNFGDTSINPSIRAIQKNIADSLRTYNYKYDSINIVRNDSIISKLSGLKSDSVSIDKYGTLYQVKNCNDSAIGTPEKAIKVIQLNKSTVSICNVGELADSIGSKISGGTTPVTKPLLKNISGTTFNSISTCEKLNLNCCWTGTIIITDAFGNSTTLTDGSGFNFDSFKGKMQGITINATGATGALISGVCE